MSFHAISVDSGHRRNSLSPRRYIGLAIRPHAPVPPRPAVRPGRLAAGDRTQERKTVRPAARQAAGRAGRRRAVPSALRDRRPALAAKNPRRGPRHDRDHRGQGHRASRAAERRARARRSRCWSRTTPATSNSCSFSPTTHWVRSRLPIGATRWISGKLELWDGHRQIVHPDRVLNAEEFARLPAVEPVYGLTEGLFQRTVARAAERALKRLPRPARMDRRRDAGAAEAAGFCRGARPSMHRPTSARGRRSGRTRRDPARL